MENNKTGKNSRYMLQIKIKVAFCSMITQYTFLSGL
jgi:hypothetical protein